MSCCGLPVKPKGNTSLLVFIRSHKAGVDAETSGDCESEKIINHARLLSGGENVTSKKPQSRTQEKHADEEVRRCFAEVFCDDG